MTGRKAILFSALLALCVHLPAISGKFIYDDHRFVQENSHIQSLSHPLRFFTDLDTASSNASPTRDIYRPIRTLSYAVIEAVAGKTPAAFHAVGIVLHAGTVALLAALLLASGLSPWVAAAGAAIYGVHPRVVECVAWISSLGDLWCGLFTVASILCYAKGRRVAAVLFLVPALFSKEHAVIVPFLWIAWDFFLARPERRGPTLGYGAAGLAVVGAFLLWRHHVGAGMVQTPEPLGGSHLSSVLTMLSALGYYAATILWPFGPTFDARVLDQHSFTLPVFLGTAVLAGLCAALFVGPRRTRLASAWFLVGLVPVSNILVPLKIPTADRFLYIPLMGVAFAAGEFFFRERARAWAAPVGTLVLFVLATSTLQRIGDWHDERSNIAAALEANPKNLTAIWRLAGLSAQEAVGDLRAGRLEDAALLAQKAEDNYRQFFRNSTRVEQGRARIEEGDLLYALGTAYQGVDREALANRLFVVAYRDYRDAHDLHLAGRGPATNAEIRHTAQRILDLSIHFARPDNPDLGKTVEAGVRAAQFLESRFGQNVVYPGSQLLLAGAVGIRARDPERARKMLDKALAGFRTVEKKQHVSTLFQRAQCHRYLAVLGGREHIDRAELERAYTLFLQSSKDSDEYYVTGLLEAARMACKIGELFHDAAWVSKGKSTLARIPKVAKEHGVRLRGSIQSEMAGLEATCGGG